MSNIVNSENNNVISSLILSELVGKEHKHILASIRQMEDAWVNLGQPKFKQSYYKNSQNKQQPMYELTKIESLYISTKFNDEARGKVILRWEELENKNKKTFEIPQNFSEALLLASKQQLVIESQNETIKKLEPRSLYFDQMISTDGLVSMQEVAKLLNIKDMGRTKLFQELRNGNVIMKNSTVPYQHFVNKGYFELKEEIVILKGGIRKVNVTTWTTQKGLAFIFKFFGLTENK